MKITSTGLAPLARLMSLRQLFHVYKSYYSQYIKSFTNQDKHDDDYQIYTDGSYKKNVGGSTAVGSQGD